MARRSLTALALAAVTSGSLFAVSGIATAATSAPAATAASAKGSGTLQISGAGFGHGIGMSQYGAMGYAEHGWNYQGILGHYYAGTTIAKTSNPAVTVLLDDGAAVFKGATAANGKKLSAATTYGVVTSGSHLEIISAGAKIATFSAPLKVTGSDLEVPRQGAYAGSLEFYPAGSGVLTVNAVDLEDYVKGVIAEEMPAGWPQQALEAQAVAARTYVLASQPVNPDYDVYDNTQSQMYGGISGETSASNLAEANTRGQVVEEDGRVIPTYFFASSGGHTESIQNVWLGSTPEPYLVGENDPYDDAADDPYYRWSDPLSLASAGGKLKGLYRGDLEGITILKHGTSPRIVSARVVGTQGSSTVSGETLQEDLGTMSTWMSFTSVTARGSMSSGSGTGSSSSSSSSPAGSSGTAGSGSNSGSGESGSSGGAGIGGNAIRRSVGSVGAVRRTVSGRVFGATRGDRVIVERWSAGRWIKVGATRIGAGGLYTARVLHSGTFRAVYDGAAAPSVTVG